MRLESQAFTHGGWIPQKFTQEGLDMSPPLIWSDIPRGTRCFALITDDPDAPSRISSHWVLFNVPPEMHRLPAGVTRRAHQWNGACNGLNSWGHLGYDGPQPAVEQHSYRFQLFALDHGMNLGPETTEEDLMTAMQGHILDSAILVGNYAHQDD